MIRHALSVGIAVATTAALLWLLLTPDVRAALQIALTRANWCLLGLAMVLSAGVQWLRAWRFAIMTSGTLALPETRLVGIAFQLNFFNFVLPFRLGELSYPVLMRRAYGQGLVEAAGILLLARIFDLSTVAAILLATAALLDLGGSPVGTALLLAAAGAFAALPTMLAILGRATRSLRSRRATGSLAMLAAGLDRLAWAPARAAAIALSFGIWLAFGVLAILTAHAAAVSMSPVVALLGASAGNLAFALPINGIAGLGPSQAAWVAAVTVAGVSFEDAVVSALALHAVVLASAILFGGLAMIGGARSMEFPRQPSALHDLDR